MTPPRIAFVVTHPIQYYGPWFAQMATQCDLTVYYAHRQSAEGQAAAGFNTAFEWDIPILDGYRHVFLENVARAPSVASFAGLDTPELKKILERERYDAVVMIGWNRKCMLQAWLGARRAGSRVFFRLDSQLETQRSLPKRLLKRPVYSAILPWAAEYLSPGQRSDAYLRHFGVPESRIHRVPHVVDVERFADAAKEAVSSGAAASLRKKCEAQDHQIVFLFVGKLIEKKRPLLALEAFAALEDHERASAALWYVGDGPLADALDQRARSLSVPIQRLGFVNQSSLPTVYAAADCLLLPSDGGETWGLVVNEAQACGLPAIVSDEAGCAPDLIDEGLTGWILQDAVVSELAGLMRKAIGKARLLGREALAGKAQQNTYGSGTTALLAAITPRMPGTLDASRRQESG